MKYSASALDKKERERKKKKNRSKHIWGVTQHLQSRAAVISYLGK